MFAGPRFSFGVNFGAPVVAAPAPAYGPNYIPPCPGPNYVWVAGFYQPNGAWVPGYWNYVAPVVVAPRVGFRMTFGGHDRDHDGDRRVVARRGGDHDRR